MNYMNGRLHLPIQFTMNALKNVLRMILRCCKKSAIVQVLKTILLTLMARAAGKSHTHLFDFFEDEFLLVVDESHMALPQLRGMYAGDRARKKSLIEFGFRLPSAFDNRPFKFEEIETYFKDVIFVSATPGEYELVHSNTIVEQIIRPTGLS